MKYVNYNANPKKWKNEGDCVVRALSTATGNSWDDVYKELFEIGFKEKRMPNSKKTFEKYLEVHNWSKVKMPKHSDNTRYTIKEFAEENNKGTYVISVANHLTMIEDGVLYDTWDCSYKSVGNYWVK